jgi:endonuclease/exonuclease/phosphatase family metal-dependent hydrolase
MDNALSIFTFNTGLVRIEMFGKKLIEPMPHVNERAEMLPQAISSQRADVVALQEIYDTRDQENVIQSLQGTYPFVVTSGIHRAVGMNDGLMILSRFPITECGFQAYRKNLLDDHLFTLKGVLWVNIDTPENGRIRLTNTHTVAGGLFRHPENPSMDAVRAEQFTQLHGLIQHGNADHRIAVGDFNAGPEASPGNYEWLLSKGYADTYAVKNPNPVDQGVTWDLANPMNCDGPHKTSPPQRIDHILVHQPGTSFQVIKSKIVLDQPRTATSGTQTTVSDHNGLVSTVQF